jgi:GNAT superfamily N-acetyltransferase
MQLTCVCGAEVRGDDRDALVGATRAHCDAAHADLSLADQQIADYVDAMFRMGPVRPRVEALGRVEVHPLTPERRDDFLRFFDTEAFADNPVWANCYCMYFFAAGGYDTWDTRSAADNRAEAAERASCGRLQGYLAYVDGEPAGWINAGPRTAFARIMEDDAYRVDDAGQVGALVCFMVAPPYRKHGLSRRLLDAALDGFRRQGLSIAEAYPTTGDPEHDADAFHGPPSLLREAGFEPIRELERQTIVRKALA